MKKLTQKQKNEILKNTKDFLDKYYVEFIEDDTAWRHSVNVANGKGMQILVLLTKSEDEFCSSKKAVKL